MIAFRREAVTKHRTSLPLRGEQPGIAIVEEGCASRSYGAALECRGRPTDVPGGKDGQNGARQQSMEMAVEGFPRFPISAPAARGRSEKDSFRPWWTIPPPDRDIEKTIEEVRTANESPNALKYRQMIADAKAELRAERIEKLVNELADEADQHNGQWWTPPTATEIAKTTLEVQKADESPNAPVHRRMIGEAMTHIRKARVDRLVKELEAEVEDFPETEH